MDARTSKLAPTPTKFAVSRQIDSEGEAISRYCRFSLTQQKGCQSEQPLIAHIVESNIALRASLIRTLEEAGLHTVAFPSPESFLAAWRPDTQGCLLLDIEFPGFHGLEFQASFKDLAVTLPIILMSDGNELPPCVRHLRPGAVQLLARPIGDTALLATVSIAYERDLARARTDREVAALMTRYNSLTAREKQVMEFVSEGLMNKQIAVALSLSVITVKVHRASMMRKMQWRRLVQAVRGADELKLHSTQERER